ncbi:MAG: OmpA family protein [Bacteroidales bacterium]|nr:OmpA family protein [Bacteroidales bacterium]
MKTRLTVIFICLVSFSWSQAVKPVVLISGKAVNERNMQPVQAKIIYEILPEGQEAGIQRSNPLNGEYKIILPYGKKYGYYAIAEGYYSVTKNLDVSDLTEYKEIDEQNLYLAPIEEDQVVRLNNLFFEGRTSVLLKESYPELDRFVEFLKINKKLTLELAGHTDNQGKADDDKKLSLERAQKVADYLISKGIKSDRILVKGYGQEQPIGFNMSEEGREMNMRVEFKVLTTGIKKS